MPAVIKQTPKRRRRKKTESGNAWDAASGIRINVYGRSGTGKTTFWSTFPSPILALVCSGGSKPGELKSIDSPENRKRIKAEIVSSTLRFDELVAEQQEGGTAATVVLDHATDFQGITLKEVLGLTEVPAQLSWGLATQQQYGQVALQMKERLRSVLSLECNVVIVAQEREFNTDVNPSGPEGGLLMPYVASALTPSVVGWLNPACDYIVQTFIRPRRETKQVMIGKKRVSKTRRLKGMEYCLRTAPHDTYTTKFRVPKGTPLPEEIVNPSYQKIVKLIGGG